MESNQIKIDFEKYAHKENNKESQAHFEYNKKPFSKQCQIVYDLLLKGEKLNTKDALLLHGIGDLRRRIKDLIDIYNVPVNSEYIEGRFKIYFLKP